MVDGWRMEASAAVAACIVGLARERAVGTSAGCHQTGNAFAKLPRPAPRPSGTAHRQARPAVPGLCAGQRRRAGRRGRYNCRKVEFPPRPQPRCEGDVFGARWPAGLAGCQRESPWAPESLSSEPWPQSLAIERHSIIAACGSYVQDRPPPPPFLFFVSYFPGAEHLFGRISRFFSSACDLGRFPVANCHPFSTPRLVIAGRVR